MTEPGLAMVSPRVRSALRTPGQVHRHPLPGKGGFHVLAVDLEIAYPGLYAGRQDLCHISLGDAAFNEGTGDHGAEAVHGKHTVNGQTEGGAQVLLCGFVDQLLERLPQFGDALAGISGYGEYGLALQEGAFHLGSHIVLHHFNPLRVHHVCFGDDHKAVLDTQKGENAQVLHRLGHKALVGGYHQHGKVDAAGSGQHVFDEFLVAGHVYDARLGAVIKVQMGETQFNSDAPLLLLHQPVGVDAGEGFDQKGLSVVHMAGGADDHMLHFTTSPAVWAI